MVGSTMLILVFAPPARDAMVVVATGVVPSLTSLAYRATTILVAVSVPLFAIFCMETVLGSLAKTAVEGTVLTSPSMVRSISATSSASRMAKVAKFSFKLPPTGAYSKSLSEPGAIYSVTSH